MNKASFDSAIQEGESTNLVAVKLPDERSYILGYGPADTKKLKEKLFKFRL